MNCIRLGIVASVALLTSLTAHKVIGRQVPTNILQSNLVPSYSANFDPKIDLARAVNFTLPPGGIAKLHNKIRRPTLIQVIKGTLTSHPQGRPEAILHAGDGLIEIDGSNYWIENTGSQTAEFMFLYIQGNRTH